MNRCGIVFWLASLALPACSGGEPEPDAPKSSSTPNVILILADDLGYGDVGAFGAQGYTTPNLDRLATEGIRFTNFYAAAPTCSASRAALMTGSYPVRVGMTSVLEPESPIGLNLDEVTIAEVLRSKGYATAAVGKWHLGDAAPFLPTRQGFDEYFGLPYSNDMEPLPLLENEQPIEESPELSQLTQRYTERARDFIATNREQPFFLYLAHTMPHVPLAVSDAFQGQSEQGLYGDVVMELDASVGQLLDTLDELALASDTLVVFASDNGPWLAYGNHAGSAGPLREGKFTTFEGGQRVPGIMRWPARIESNSVSAEVVTMLDLLPTIAAITGAALPEWPIDGRSILSTLEGAPATSPPETVYFYDGSQLEAVRSERWKFHLPHRYETVVAPGADGKGGQRKQVDLPMSLFDLDSDPGEATNLADQYPDVVTRLSAVGAEFDSEVKRNQRPVGQL